MLQPYFFDKILPTTAAVFLQYNSLIFFFYSVPLHKYTMLTI